MSAMSNVQMAGRGVWLAPSDVGRDTGAGPTTRTVAGQSRRPACCRARRSRATNTGTARSDDGQRYGGFPFPWCRSQPQVNIAQGFKAADYTDVIVAVGQEYSLTAKLALGEMTDVVTVTAGSSLVSTTSPEVSATVMQRQVLDIPLANRDVTNLIKLQPGVQPFTTGRTRASTRAADVDTGHARRINIRTASSHELARLLPNRPTSDTVAGSRSRRRCRSELAGASAVRMIPICSNRFTGSVFEFNRDSVAANSFFNAATRRWRKPELAGISSAGAPAVRSEGQIVLLRLLRVSDHADLRTSRSRQRTFHGVFRYAGTDGVKDRST
jgi:hypothetical protein